MLAKWHNSPFRRDVIERAAKGSLRDHQVSLQQLGNLSPTWGLLGALTELAKSQLHRVPIPCFTLYLGPHCGLN